MGWKNRTHLASRANSPMSVCRLRHCNCSDSDVHPPLARVSIITGMNTLAVRHGREQSYVSERQSQTYANGASSPHSFSIASYTSHRIVVENALKESDGPRQRNRRRLARGVHNRHAQDTFFITPENVHQRPQWRFTPLGWLFPANAHAARLPARPANRHSQIQERRQKAQ